MRLYRVQSDCRKCTHRYRFWITESQRKASLQSKPNDLYAVQVCPVQRCGEDLPILARHVREADFDAARTEAVARNPLLRNLYLRPDLSPSVPALTERQAKVCALILEGKSDRAIARALFVSKPTVRKEIRQIAAVFCADEPVACRVFPRQTIVAYNTARNGANLVNAGAAA